MMFFYFGQGNCELDSMLKRYEITNAQPAETIDHSKYSYSQNENYQT